MRRCACAVAVREHEERSANDLGIRRVHDGAASSGNRLGAAAHAEDERTLGGSQRHVESTVCCRAAYRERASDPDGHTHDTHVVLDLAVERFRLLQWQREVRQRESGVATEHSESLTPRLLRPVLHGFQTTVFADHREPPLVDAP